ncbi:unnamed protein product [Sphacelaria rigidula]
MPQGATDTFYDYIKRLILATLARTNPSHIIMCLDDAIAFDASPIAHIRTLRQFLSRLRIHDLKLSPSKPRLGATDLDFLGHSIPPAGLHPDTNKVEEMTDFPMPTNISQLRSLWGRLSFYRKFLPNLSKWMHILTELRKKGAVFFFTIDMKSITRESLKALSEKPVLCFPDWEAVQDGSRLFQLHTDASTNGFGGVLNQPQVD